MIDELLEKWLKSVDSGSCSRNKDGTWNYIDVADWVEFKSFETWLKENNIKITIDTKR